MSDTDRLARKRQKTRLALLAAARKLVYERGHERVAIQDITEHADIGIGTFYNYFESKQAIFAAVLEEIRDGFRQELNGIRKPLKDPALIVSHTLRFCFRHAQDNTDWNTFVMYSGLEGDTMLHQDESQCLEDLARGVAAGRFKIDDIPFAQNLILGMVRHVNTAITRGQLGRNAMEETTEYIMCMLGLPKPVAKGLVQTPMPPISVSPGMNPPASLPRLIQA